MAAPARICRAFVLRCVDYGEADRIVTLLTLEHGRVSVIARSARRSRRRFAGGLEPCALLEAEVALGAGELGRLASTRLVRPFAGILADLDRLAAAGAATELVRELVPAREPDARIFQLLERLYERVESSPSPLEILLRFELRLLALAGFAPSLEACGRCGKAAPGVRAAGFAPSSGTLVCQACGGAPVTLSGGLRGKLAAALRSGWDEDEHALSPTEVEAARAAIEPFAAHCAGKALAGASVISQIRALRGQGA